MTTDDPPPGPRRPGEGTPLDGAPWSDNTAAWDAPPAPCFGRPEQNHLCAQLRALYAALDPTPLPTHMTILLDRLRSREDRRERLEP